MTDTNVSSLENTISKTNVWLNEIQEELNLDNKEEAYTALRESLHFLRDEMSDNDAANFAAQMPMMIKGIYYEGWSLGQCMDGSCSQSSSSSVSSSSQQSNGSSNHSYKHNGSSADGFDASRSSEQRSSNSSNTSEQEANITDGISASSSEQSSRNASNSSSSQESSNASSSSSQNSSNSDSNISSFGVSEEAQPSNREDVDSLDLSKFEQQLHSNGDGIDVEPKAALESVLHVIHNHTNSSLSDQETVVSHSCSSNCSSSHFSSSKSSKNANNAEKMETS